jgi:hypothetical protein
VKDEILAARPGREPAPWVGAVAVGAVAVDVVLVGEWGGGESTYTPASVHPLTSTDEALRGR